MTHASRIRARAARAERSAIVRVLDHDPSLVDEFVLHPGYDLRRAQEVEWARDEQRAKTQASLVDGEALARAARRAEQLRTETDHVVEATDDHRQALYALAAEAQSAGPRGQYAWRAWTAFLALHPGDYPTPWQAFVVGLKAAADYE